MGVRGVVEVPDWQEQIRQVVSQKGTWLIR